MYLVLTCFKHYFHVYIFKIKFTFGVKHLILSVIVIIIHICMHVLCLKMPQTFLLCLYIYYCADDNANITAQLVRLEWANNG